MSEPPIIKDPTVEPKSPASLVTVVAKTMPLGKLMLQIMFEGKYKALSKEKGFDKYPAVSVDAPKEVDLKKKFGKGKNFDQYMKVWGDLLFQIFENLSLMPDAETIKAHEVVNYKHYLPSMLGTGDAYEIGLRLKNKKEITEWSQLRNKNAKEMAALFPTVPEIVLVITKK